MPVVGFDDFDIHTVAQRPRRHIHQLEAEIDTNAHIWREHNRDVLRGTADFGFLFSREASRADDHGLTSGLTDMQMIKGRRRTGEVCLLYTSRCV